MIKVVHIITDLDSGGAEAMLYKLLSATDQAKQTVHVISLMDEGVHGEKIRALGIPLDCLNLNAGHFSLGALSKLRSLAKTLQADVVQGWMYHGNLAAYMFSKFCKHKISQVWNIRQTLYSLEKEKKLTQWVIRAGAHLSNNIDRIIYNSNLAAEQHAEFGYKRANEVILANGFDVDQFRPSASARNNLRQVLGLSASTCIVGIVGRFHPMKCQTNFIHAAAQIYATHPEVHYVMFGHDIVEQNPVLAECLQSSPGKQNFHLLGERSDIAELTAAFDIAVSSSSWGEGFPNVIGEAMSCAVPCVVTDVGESPTIVQDTGVVVPPASIPLLADGILTLINMSVSERQALGGRARQRIIELYSIEQVSTQYESLYYEVA